MVVFARILKMDPMPPSVESDEDSIATTTCLCTLFMDLFFGPSDLGEAFTDMEGSTRPGS